MPDTTPLIEAVRALARLSRLIERASDELSLADYRVLSAIVGGEGRASRLASRLALGKPAISSTIDSLGKRGLVARSSVEGDNRAIALSVTAQGMLLFERVETRMTRQLELLSERTPDGPQAIESLAWLGTAIETIMAERSASADEAK